jgi:hypothetical protein
MNALAQDIAAVLNEIAETQAGTGITFDADYNENDRTLIVSWQADWEMGEGEASKFHALPKNNTDVLSVEVNLPKHFAVYKLGKTDFDVLEVCDEVSGDYPRE